MGLGKMPHWRNAARREEGGGRDEARRDAVWRSAAAGVRAAGRARSRGGNMCTPKTRYGHKSPTCRPRWTSGGPPTPAGRSGAPTPPPSPSTIARSWLRARDSAGFDASLRFFAGLEDHSVWHPVTLRPASALWHLACSIQRVVSGIQSASHRLARSLRQKGLSYFAVAFSVLASCFAYPTVLLTAFP